MVDKETDDFDFEVEEATDQQEDNSPEIEIEDDTPPEDRGREPMPEELVQELEADELEDYSDKVKTRLKQMKKVWHDERREKERESREKAEALAAAQRLLEENRKLKSTISYGEETLISSFARSAELEMDQAKRAYKEAYEEGDSDKLIQAQEWLNNTTYKMQQIKNYVPTLQNQVEEVQQPVQQVAIPRPDSKTLAWQERNSWWGSDPEMTASALGLHQKLERERGPHFIGSDEYWQAVDTTMRRRFPEYFGDEKAVSKSRAATVVAPASRSTSPKKIRLTSSQVAIAKRLGLTPKQYAEELMKMEQ